MNLRSRHFILALWLFWAFGFLATFGSDFSYAQEADNFKNGLAQGIGQGIGQQVGQELGAEMQEKAHHDMILNMTPRDRLAYLNLERMALRSEILRRYVFQAKDTSVKGYLRTLREGEDEDGNLCREYESDLIVEMSRKYFIETVCEIQGQWKRTPKNRIYFDDEGQPQPLNSRRTKPQVPGGGWLPPLEK